MKRKFAGYEELNNFFGDYEWQVKELPDSPLVEVALPDNYLFTTGSACISLVTPHSGPSTAVAGMDVFRQDLNDSPYILNVDHFSIYSTRKPDWFEIVEIKPEYHRISSINGIPNDTYNTLGSQTKELLDRTFNFGTVKKETNL